MTGTKIELGPSGKTVAANVHRLRTEQNLSWTVLSRRLTAAGRRITPISVRRIEARERRVDVDDLVALAVTLGCSPATLLMPATDKERDLVEVTGVPSTVAAGRLWEWIRGNGPLPPTTEVGSLTFRIRANPSWNDFWAPRSALRTKKKDDQ